MSKSARTYLCSGCLNRHQAPTGKKCPFVKKPNNLEDVPEDRSEEVFHSLCSARVDRLLSCLDVSKMGLEGDNTKDPTSQNAALLDIVKIQQEQMKALCDSIPKMKDNMSSLSKKVSKKSKARKEPLDDLTDTTSSSSDSDDLLMCDR